MNNIFIVIAADINFKLFFEKCNQSCVNNGYNTIIYDLGGLGTGKEFNGRFSEKTSAKIPSKPDIILDALNQIENNDYLVWLDADTILWDTIEEIKLEYDIAVTLRKPKELENDLPINAGVIFFRKNSNTINFINRWSKACENSKSDQLELNNLLNLKNSDLNTVCVKENLTVQVFSCDIYNNFYFKKSQLHAKITHYKSKHRFRWPDRTTVNIIKPKRIKEKNRYNK